MTPTEPRPLTDEQALYLAVLSAPWEDGPRLFLADYWDDHNPPQGGVTPETDRAEFLRTQCELAKRVRETGSFGMCKPGCPPDCQCQLRRREHTLLDANGWEWVGTQFPTYPDAFLCKTEGTDTVSIGQRKFKFSRGFIGLITCSWGDWLAHHETLYYHPWQRVECPAVSYNPTHYGCTKCSASGTIPRPIMEKVPQYTHDPASDTERITRYVLRNVLDTAQPIQEVRLTDTPFGRDDFPHGGDWTPSKDGKTFTDKRFPTVTFHLPETA